MEFQISGMYDLDEVAAELTNEEFNEVRAVMDTGSFQQIELPTLAQSFLTNRRWFEANVG